MRAIVLKRRPDNLFANSPVPTRCRQEAGRVTHQFANPLKSWLGRQDLNLGMAESKSAAYSFLALNGKIAHSVEIARQFE